MNIQLGYQPGAIGRIAQLHAAFYSRTAHFGAPFEAKVAMELAQFCLTYQPDRDGLWLAEQDGVIHGSIAIDGSRSEEKGAHLRWFIASDECKGQGVGSRLLEAAMAFCEARGYRRVYLWTFDQLQVARRLYEKHGFRLAQTERGSQWGREVNEHLFVLGDA
ncbi:MAG: GNAT family N-acetyltransferase [Burkholderiaceae bacterium]